MAEADLGLGRHPSGEGGLPGGTDLITPDSMLFQLVGDQRYALSGLAAGNLQLMIPAIGAGVTEHSDFFNDPWDRVFRSLPKIIGSVCDPDAKATAEWIWKRHNKIEGADDGHGNPYRAQDPEVFWDAHATFTVAAFDMADRYTDWWLDADQEEQLYRESVGWYQRFDENIDMAPVPRNYRAFKEKWHYISEEVLEMTPAAERSIDIGQRRDIPRPPNITEKQWKVLKKPVSEVVSLAAIGGIPEDVRERLDIAFSLADKAKLKAFELLVRKGFRFLPEDMRYYPQALNGMAAAEAA